LSAYLYQNSICKLFEYKELDMVSKPDETEEEFRKKIALPLKSYQDEQIYKLRAGYDKKTTTLKDKIRRAEEKKNTQQQQSLYQKFEAGLSFLTTLIGAMFGKKLNQTTINQAGTTFRRMGRIGKESQDVSNSEETLTVLQQQLQDMQAQLNDDIAKVTAIDAAHLKLDEVTIRPRKTDIMVDEIALIWWP